MTELAEGLKNLPKDRSVSLRTLKEIEDKKASKAQRPSVKPAAKSEPANKPEKESVGGAADETMYEKETVALDRKSLELEPGQKGSWNKALNKELDANTDYKVGNYIYQTDHAGNVNRVSGKLQLETRDRNTYQQTKSAEAGGIKEGLPTDDGGHLVASIFDGPGEQINYSPMNSNLNRGQWKRMENKWADALNSGKEVSIDIKPIYEGSSKRPSAFKVKYWIDGKTKTAFFENKHGG